MFLFATTAANAEIVAIPSPEVMVTESSIVAICTLHRVDSTWRIDVIERLKGAASQNDDVEVRSPYSDMAFSIETMATVVGDARFLFIGRLDAAGKAVAGYGMLSWWPQGDVQKNLLPAHDLAGCVNFAKTTLGIPPTSSDTPNSSDKAPVSGMPPPAPRGSTEPQAQEVSSQNDNKNAARYNGHPTRLVGALVVLLATAILVAFFCRSHRRPS